MKMIFAALILAPVMAFASSASDIALELVMRQNALFQQADKGLDWKVGDENNYKVDIGFIKGLMQNKVTSIGEDGLWMEQNVDLGFAGKQQVKSLLDRETGEVKRLIINGKEETPQPSKIEIVDMKRESVTVPAGTFETIRARIKDLVTNEEYDLWVNDGTVPMSGMVKSVQPTGSGPATISLTSFIRH